jgi:hypothetical protein
MALHSSGGRRTGDSVVAEPITPIVAEPAIAFGDCDRPPTLASSAAVTRIRASRHARGRLPAAAKALCARLAALTQTQVLVVQVADADHEAPSGLMTKIARS